MFEKGLSGGSLSSAKDSLQVWTAYLDYLRRRVHIHDDQVQQHVHVSVTCIIYIHVHVHVHVYSCVCSNRNICTSTCSHMYIEWRGFESHLRRIFSRKSEPWVCCVALPCLFVCLCLLLSFFLLSSLIKTCTCLLWIMLCVCIILMLCCLFVSCM